MKFIILIALALTSFMLSAQEKGDFSGELDVMGEIENVLNVDSSDFYVVTKQGTRAKPYWELVYMKDFVVKSTIKLSPHGVGPKATKYGAARLEDGNLIVYGAYLTSDSVVYYSEKFNTELNSVEGIKKEGGYSVSKLKECAPKIKLMYSDNRKYSAVLFRFAMGRYGTEHYSYRVFNDSGDKILDGTAVSYTGYKSEVMNHFGQYYLSNSGDFFFVRENAIYLLKGGVRKEKYEFDLSHHFMVTSIHADEKRNVTMIGVFDEKNVKDSIGYFIAKVNFDKKILQTMTQVRKEAKKAQSRNGKEGKRMIPLRSHGLMLLEDGSIVGIFEETSAYGSPEYSGVHTYTNGVSNYDYFMTGMSEQISLGAVWIVKFDSKGGFQWSQLIDKYQPVAYTNQSLVSFINVRHGNDLMVIFNDVSKNLSYSGEFWKLKPFGAQTRNSVVRLFNVDLSNGSVTGGELMEDMVDKGYVISIHNSCYDADTKKLNAYVKSGSEDKFVVHSLEY